MMRATSASLGTNPAVSVQANALATAWMLLAVPVLTVACGVLGCATSLLLNSLILNVFFKMSLQERTRAERLAS